MKGFVGGTDGHTERLRVVRGKDKEALESTTGEPCFIRLRYVGGICIDQVPISRGAGGITRSTRQPWLMWSFVDYLCQTRYALEALGTGMVGDNYG